MNHGFSEAGYGAVPEHSSVPASRHWWDLDADEYFAEHGDFLGDSELVWGPEGIIEDDVAHLGNVAGLAVLEIGCGGAHGARWATKNGAKAIASDLSFAMLRHGQRVNKESGVPPPLVQANGLELPFADESFDVVFTAYGVVPFIPRLDDLHREVARVLKPRGRWVYSTTHPIRWAFPDSPTEAGLTVSRSYFDTTPYAEWQGKKVVYVEHHHTISAHVTALSQAGFRLQDISEPQWPAHNQQTWGGWSPLRGKYLPGTAIFISQKLAQ